MTLSRLCCTLASAALCLMACAGGLPGETAFGESVEIDAVEALPIHQNPYLGALQEGYLGLLRTELANRDMPAARVFNDRALKAAAGESFGPFDPTEREIDGPEGQRLRQAFKELTAFGASEGPMLRAGRQIGEAQVKYDCWFERALEGAAPDAIAECRDGFDAIFGLAKDLGSLPDDLVVILPSNGEIGGIQISQGTESIELTGPYAAAGIESQFGDLSLSEAEVREVFAGALAARPPPPILFTLEFEPGSAAISDAAFDTVEQIVSEIRARAASDTLLVGFGGPRSLVQRRLRVLRKTITDNSALNDTLIFTPLNGVVRPIQPDGIYLQNTVQVLVR